MNIDIVKESDDTIPIYKIIDEINPILWCRNGEYRIVPREVIENVIDVLSMYMASDGKYTQPVLMIRWNQGIPISNQAGRILMGE